MTEAKTSPKQSVPVSLAEYYKSESVGVSLELFPPKTGEGEEELFTNLRELVSFGPSYITCTYGAGGSTQDRTLDILERVRKEFSLPIAAHLTCVGSTVDELRAFLQEAKKRNVNYIMALRGDPPKGEDTFVQTEGGLRYANELVALIRAEFPQFGIAVAGYPETHQEAPNRAVDLENLKRKVDSGADIVITQLFYDNEDYFRFRDSCEAMGISVPIIPGILPVTNVKMIKRVASLCGASLPPAFLHRLEAQVDDPQGQFDAGVYHATRQVEDLMSRGAHGVHFYCLNKSRAVATILRALTLLG